MNRHASVLRLIGAFKLFKGDSSGAAAIAALRLLHRDIGEVIIRWALRLHVSPGNPHVQELLAKVYSSHGELKLLPIVFALYTRDVPDRRGGIDAAEALGGMDDGADHSGAHSHRSV